MTEMLKEPASFKGAVVEIWKASPFDRKSDRHATRLWPLFFSIALISGCDSYKNISLNIQRERLMQQCFGESTNTCTSKNIDFDIAVLKATDSPRWIPFKEVRTQQQMVDAFGPEGWALFEQSVDEVRNQMIAHLQSRRPGRLSRWFMGDERPFNGGVRAFFDADDLVPIQQQIEREFVRKLTAAGWKPSAEALARYGGDLSSPSAVSAKPDSEAESRPRQSVDPNSGNRSPEEVR